MQKRNTLGPRATMSALGFISGFVDTLGFITLYGLFAAHITGNVVLLASAVVVDHRYGVAIKLLAIPTFIVAAIVTRFFIIRRERRMRDATAHVLLAEAVLLCGFMVLALASTPFAGQDSPEAIATGLVAAAAMGVQNTAARTIMSGLPPTTVMTGNLIQIIVDVVDLLHGHGELPAKRERLSKLVPLMLAFGAGTLLGAVGYLTIGFAALIAPIVVAASLGLMGRAHPATAAA